MPETTSQSFKDALTSHAALPLSAASTGPSTRGRLATHKGFPSVVFSKPQIEKLSDVFPWTLVGKFFHGYNKQQPKLGRPPVEDLYKYFEAMDLKCEFQLGLLDNRHLLIRLHHEEDYLRLYSRPVWYVKGMPMRIFKWTNNFHVDRESPIVPVWITLPRLPIHFFAQDPLFSIASAIGVPLRLDAATLKLTRPSMARVQVEIDVLKERPNKLWIGCDDGDGFWQKIEYDEIPAYCQHCWHIGHSEAMCHIHNPELKHHETSVQPAGNSHPQRRQIYVPIVAKEGQASGSGKIPHTPSENAISVVPSNAASEQQLPIVNSATTAPTTILSASKIVSVENLPVAAVDNLSIGHAAVVDTVDTPSNPTVVAADLPTTSTSPNLIELPHTPTSPTAPLICTDGGVTSVPTSRLTGLVAQEIGFPPTTVVEDSDEDVELVYEEPGTLARTFSFPSFVDRGCEVQCVDASVRHTWSQVVQELTLFKTKLDSFTLKPQEVPKQRGRPAGSRNKTYPLQQRTVVTRSSSTPSL